jgi:hypothetical protein
MSRRKSDKPEDQEQGGEEPKMAPWACEVEFYDKPSFMSSVLELSIDAEHISIVQESGTILAFPYEAVTKILIMHTKPKDIELS